MSTSLTATFEDRRDADMAVEHLVQEYGIERGDIVIAAAGDDDSGGGSGSDGDDDRDEDAPNGSITVSVDVEDDDLAVEVRDTFDEFNAESVVVD